MNLQSVGVWYGNLHSFRLHTPSVGLFTFRQSKNLSIIAMKSLVSVVMSWSMYVDAFATVSRRTYQFTKITTIHNTVNKQQFWLKNLLGRAYCARACVCMYVCMSVCLRPYTENFKWVQRRLPGVEMTEVEVHMATYSRRQVAHRQYKVDHDGGWGRFR